LNLIWGHKVTIFISIRVKRMNGKSGFGIFPPGQCPKEVALEPCAGKKKGAFFPGCRGEINGRRVGGRGRLNGGGGNPGVDVDGVFYKVAEGGAMLRGEGERGVQKQIRGELFLVWRSRTRGQDKKKKEKKNPAGPGDFAPKSGGGLWLVRGGGGGGGGTLTGSNLWPHLRPGGFSEKEFDFGPRRGRGRVDGGG